MSENLSRSKILLLSPNKFTEWAESARSLNVAIKVAIRCYCVEKDVIKLLCHFFYIDDRIFKWPVILKAALSKLQYASNKISCFQGTYCSVSSKHQPLCSYRVLVLKIGCCFNAKEPVSMHLRLFLFSSAAMTPVEYRELEYGRVTWGRGRRLRTRGRGSAKTKPVLYTQIILMAYFLWKVHISVRVIPHIFPAWIGQFSNSRCFDKASVHTFTIWLFEWSFAHAQRCFIQDLCPHLPILPT